ncbi:MAG: PIN domain-containing protein [Rhodothermales bacterium]|nr:PIN domain-containing protein [Rhodothermales bacterium]
MFANRFTAVVDACVLFSPLKRNLILSLAEAELFRIRWSEEILDETQSATKQYLTGKGCTDADDRAIRARTSMEKAFVDALVCDYDTVAEGLNGLPDEKDRHVIAAAIKCRSDIIVTENLKDFPPEILDPFHLEAKCSDDFIADTIDLNLGVAISAIRRMRLRLKKPEMTPEALLLEIEKHGLTQTADQLRDCLALLE